MTGAAGVLEPPMFDEPVPEQPLVFFTRHEHEFVEVGAHQQPNGVWQALLACTLCPDVYLGQRVGPIPNDWCPCGWVQKKPGRTKCEDCKRPLDRGRR